MQARKETFEEYTQLVTRGWLYGSGNGEEYPHFYKRVPSGQSKFGLRLTLVLTEKGWQWGVDKPGWTGVMGAEAFEDPIACLLAAELAGWEP